jgi:predicted transcriptional regulator
LTEDEKATKNMTLRLDRELAARVEALAEIESIPVTQVIRSALSSHLEQRKRDPDFQSKLQRQLARQAQIERMFAVDEGAESGADPSGS